MALLAIHGSFPGGFYRRLDFAFNLFALAGCAGGGFLSDEAYYKYTAQERKGAQILMIIFVVSYVFKLNLILFLPKTAPANFIIKSINTLARWMIMNI